MVEYPGEQVPVAEPEAEPGVLPPAQLHHQLLANHHHLGVSQGFAAAGRDYVEGALQQMARMLIVSIQQREIFFEASGEI